MLHLEAVHALFASHHKQSRTTSKVCRNKIRNITLQFFSIMLCMLQCLQNKKKNISYIGKFQEACLNFLHITRELKQNNLLKVSPKLQKVFLYFSRSKEVCFLHVQRCCVLYVGRLIVCEELTLHTSHTSIIRVTSAVIMCSNVLGLTPSGCQPFHFPLFLPHNI